MLQLTSSSPISRLISHQPMLAGYHSAAVGSEWQSRESFSCLLLSYGAAVCRLVAAFLLSRRHVAGPTKFSISIDVAKGHDESSSGFSAHDTISCPILPFPTGFLLPILRPAHKTSSVRLSIGLRSSHLPHTATWPAYCGDGPAALLSKRLSCARFFFSLSPPFLQQFLSILIPWMCLV